MSCWQERTLNFVRAVRVDRNGCARGVGDFGGGGEGVGAGRGKGGASPGELSDGAMEQTALDCAGLRSPRGVVAVSGPPREENVVHPRWTYRQRVDDSTVLEEHRA